MVGMGVGNQDVCHPLVLSQCAYQCFHMAGVVGTGINYRNPAVTNDVGAGSVVGVWT